MNSFKLAILLMALPYIVFSQKTSISIDKNGWIDFNKNGKKDVFEDKTKPTELRIKDLLSQMNVNEKTCQLATLYGYGRVLKDKQPTADWKNQIWKDGIANIDEQLNGVKTHRTFEQNEFTNPFDKHAEAINTIQKWFIEETRMGIPVDFTNEAIHGLTHPQATPLPAPIAIGSTWNLNLIKKAGQIVGQEAKALGYTNVYAPVLDMARDPRWGRTVECYGEDPFLIGEMGVAMTQGIQSQGVAATLKHYAVYSVPKGARDGRARTDPHVAPREMHDIFLEPFAQVIKRAQPLGVMSSYNDYDGVPVSASKYFLTDLLRKKFGFNGYVVSDSEAVEFVQTKHHTAGDYTEAVRQCFEAGLNVRTHFKPAEEYILALRTLYNTKQISMKTLNERVGDVLRVKFKLGLFDEPLVKEPSKANQIVGEQFNEGFVKDMARESIVLLKNKDNFLPLDISKTKKILVTGPLAAETKHLISRYGPSSINITSVLKGLQNYTQGKAEVVYKKGCELLDATWPESEIIPTELTAEETAMIEEAVTAAKNVDVIVAVCGEDELIVGEMVSRTGLDLPGRQQQLLQALYKTGKPVILILANGQPLTINWANRYLHGILETWFGNTRMGEAVAETIFGQNNPSGRLSMTFPKTTGQIEYNFPYKPGSHADQTPIGNNEYGTSSVNGALYPFGFGLSYSKFEYSNMAIQKESLGQKDSVQVTVTVKNNSQIPGYEVVQWYVRDEVSSVISYDKLLRGFEKVYFKAGESKNITFKMAVRDVWIRNEKMEKVTEPGWFTVFVGPNSENLPLKVRYLVR